MKELLVDAHQKEARGCASPVQNIKSCNRSFEFGGQEIRDFLIHGCTVGIKAANRIS